MSNLAEILHFSEDYSLLHHDAADRAKVEFAQYHAKNYDFWNAGRVTRSINRWRVTEITSPQSSLDSDQFEKHPIEALSTINVPSTHPDAGVIDFPDVFEQRLIGEKSVNTLQEWECRVEFIDNGVVTAIGTSLIDDDPEQNILEIPVQEFAANDQRILEPGIVFRLIIGFSKKLSGQRIRESICYVRRNVAVASSGVDGIQSL